MLEQQEEALYTVSLQCFILKKWHHRIFEITLMKYSGGSQISRHVVWPEDQIRLLKISLLKGLNCTANMQI
jgi:hypothetical protein